MRRAGSARDGVPGWDIATPSRPGRLPGVRMAGFRDRAGDSGDLMFVPHPAVTLLIDLGDGMLVDEGSGQQLHGSLAFGLAPCGIQGRARDFECLQVRVSPAVAYAALGASAEMGGTVTAFADLWGAGAARLR